MNVKKECAIITPIGPGHETLYQQCSSSINKAIAHSKGVFDNIIPMPIDDSQGKLGRSKARNMAIKKADERNIEWIFFLDADDFLAENAFSSAAPFMDEYDAIWGQIYENFNGKTAIEKRKGQLESTSSINDILFIDPFFTLQMGHFVKTSVALKNPFDESMDTGEDFHYYLRVWEHFKTVKIPPPLFINRRGAHSTGPRSADGRHWRINVEQLITQYKKRLWGDLDHKNIATDPPTLTSTVPVPEKLRALISIVVTDENTDLYPAFFKQLKTVSPGNSAYRIQMQASPSVKDSRILKEFAHITPNFALACCDGPSFPQGHNQNLEAFKNHADIEYLITMTPEILCPLPQWLDQVLNLMDKHPDMAMMAPLTLTLSDQEPNLGEIQQKPAENTISSDSGLLLNAAFSVIRATSLSQVGGFDTGLTSGHYEDIDLSMKLKKQGFTLASAPIPAMIQQQKGAETLSKNRLPLHRQASDSQIQADKKQIIDRWLR